MSDIGLIPYGERLWPDGGGEPHRFLPLVRDGTIRSLIPADSPRLMRLALLRSNGPERPARRAARRVYSAVSPLTVRSGRSAVVEITGSGLRDRLAADLGRPVHLAVHFGPPRANRKPVVHALDDDGRLLAVAKLGVNELTDALIRDETAALGVLASHGVARDVLTVPRVVSAEPFGGSPMLVQSALPLPGRHRHPRDTSRRAAEQEIFERGAQGSFDAYVADLRGRLAALSERTETQALITGLDVICARLATSQVPVGASHGDWSPQNVAALGTGIGAWDWERYSPARPLGYDSLHYRFQTLLADTNLPQPGVRLLDQAADLLAPWHSGHATMWSPGIAGLVLLDLTARYVGDSQPGTGTSGSRALDWVGPALSRLTS